MKSGSKRVQSVNLIENCIDSLIPYYLSYCIEIKWLNMTYVIEKLRLKTLKTLKFQIENESHGAYLVRN